jgi:DNA-binding beta-propeller fold protein YncE
VLQQYSLQNDGADGLAWDNANLWHNNNDQSGSGDTTFHISSSTGQVLDHFLPFGPQPTGLAFDGTYLWSSDNYYDEIYKIDLNSYTIIDTIDAPGGDYPNGLTFDGQYLWVANNDADSLYQIDIGFTPTGLNDFSNKSGQIIVYPNPSSGSFVIEGDLIINNNSLSINIYDLEGHKIFTKQFLKDNSAIINLKSYKSGMFFYTISNENKILESGKLVKK